LHPHPLPPSPTRRSSDLLESPAAKDRCAARGNRVRRLEELVSILDGTGPGHDGQPAVADNRVLDVDDSVLGMEFARRQLEWPARSEEHTSELQSRVDLVC